MDVWMTWNKRIAKCKYCEKEILVSTPMVVGQTKKGNRTYRMYFHPQCWVDNGMVYLNNNPYTSGCRGRKKLPLSPDDSRKRFLLIRRYNTLKSRKKNLKRFPDDILESIRLEDKMRGIMVEMENIGGIPSKWAVERIAIPNT
jgi:hypothetical protein